MKLVWAAVLFNISVAFVAAAAVEVGSSSGSKGTAVDSRMLIDYQTEQ